MNKTTELVKLITENPDLPVIPMVSTQCKLGGDSDYYCASLGSAKVEEYAIVELSEEKLFVTKDSLRYIEDCFAEEISDDNPDLSEEVVANMAHEKVAEIEWSKAIVVYIEELEKEDV